MPTLTGLGKISNGNLITCQIQLARRKLSGKVGIRSAASQIELIWILNIKLVIFQRGHPVVLNPVLNLETDGPNREKWPSLTAWL